MTEQTDAPIAPKPGSDEYNQAMAARAREARGEVQPQQVEEEAEAPQAPDVPEKFRNEDGSINAEALLKSYAELEKLKSKAPEGEQGETPATTEASDDAAASMAEKAGLSYDALKAKIVANGTIEEADYAALEATGIPRSLVDDLIRSRVAEAERNHERAVSYVGGEEQTNALLQWAGENLTEEEITLYNGMLAGSNWKRAVDALTKMRGTEERKTAGEPKLAQPGSTAGAGVQGYQNRDDMKADMANPLYNKRGSEGDRFRAEVQRKVALSRNNWTR